METISAAEANRNFSRILQGVREGRSFTVTSHGKPIARITPAETRQAEAEMAWKSLMERLESQPASNVRPWTRDELYDD